MSPADAPDRLLLAYRLDTGIAVVTVTGEVDAFTGDRSEIASFGSSAMKTIAAWS